MKQTKQLCKRLFCLLLTLSLFISMDIPAYAVTDSAEVSSQTETATTEASSEDDSINSETPSENDSTNSETSSEDDSSNLETPSENDSTNSEASSEDDSANTETPSEDDSANTETSSEDGSTNTEAPSEDGSINTEAPSANGSANTEIPSENGSTETGAPDTPQNQILTPPELTASVQSKTSVLLKWKTVSGANGYEIYRSTSKNGKYKKITTVTGRTKYTDKKLTTGKTYYYRMKAYQNINNKKIYSEFSTRVSVKVTLKAPILQSIRVKDYKTLTLKWKKTADADGYLIYRSTKENGSYKKIATISGGKVLSYINTGLSTGKTYYYKVRAYMRAGKKTLYGDYSAVVSQATTLKKVSGVTATPQHTDKIKLTWKKVKGAASYNIYRRDSKNGTFSLIKSNVKATSYTDKKLKDGKRYYYKISARKNQVMGERSNTVSTIASSLRLNQTSVVVQKRFSVTLEASASPKAKIKWSSADPNIATVSSKGTIKGIGVGATTVYAKANGVTRSIKVRVRQTLDGIDVSKWQGKIDFKKVKNAGYNFVMIRIHSGIDKDPNFETYYKDAKAAGLGIGVYYYSYATTAAQADSDAKTILRILNGRTLNYPVIIDMEDNKQLIGVTNKTRTDIAQTFCNTIKASGYEAGLYANTYWLDNYFENKRLKNMNIWAARWQNLSLGHEYTGYGNVFMWQYSSTGKVNGITGNVDLNLGFSD